MKPTVYIETTIPSYLTAWRSPNVVMAGHQEMTEKWWDQRDQFQLFVSEFVLKEASAGDPVAAVRRLASLTGITRLDEDDASILLSETLIREVPFPTRAHSDALYIGIAAVNGINYLLTWNFTHIANVTLRAKIRQVCENFGVTCPEICTPEELLKGSVDA